MEGLISSTESAASESSSAFELLILHTEEAQEWAAYLQQILNSSKQFQKNSVLLYAVSSADQLHGYNFKDFQCFKCIVVILTGLFLDILCDQELHEALQRLLYPPHKVVALLCGVSEDSLSAGCFADWQSWRKLHADDEPAIYVSTVLESIADSRRAEVILQNETPAAELNVTEASPVCSENPTVAESEEEAPEEQTETFLKEEEQDSRENSTSETISSETQLTCLCVQPNRVRCGDQETLYIIFKSRIGSGSDLEVEFSTEDSDSSKRVLASLENEFTISVPAPEMPAGVTLLTLHADGSDVSLSPVTYYTSMGEVSRYLTEVADPVNFICQAFDWTCNSTESVDTLLTDSLKSKMPASGLQLFGVKQIEEENMSAYQRDEELPTLLHFSAKYGLKKLTSILLRCPGALQAYSVMNKHGDYPNKLAEKSGFQDLRQFMDEFVETADMLQSHIIETLDEDVEIYEPMTNSSQDMMIKLSVCSEDIYESMLDIDPNCAEDLYEVMTAVDENPEEAMLRKFFEAKPQAAEEPVNHHRTEDHEPNERNNFDEVEEEEDPYNICREDIYDTVDIVSTYTPAVVNRPPAPIPRPQAEREPERPERPATYISKVFSDRRTSQVNTMGSEYPAARPVSEAPSSTYDPYGGMKTPGQRQLISLQERVKVGEITVDEAVQEFKAWQLDHERRANSLRYQQDNLRKLRESITRRHKEREKSVGEREYEITAPLQRNLYWQSNMTIECDVYEPTPRVSAPPPPAVHPIKRSSWKTGSTSSTSSTESNRLSTHSNFSLSSGTEQEFEDAVEILPPPPRPPRPSDPLPSIPPPRIPPRIPERVPEKVNERYISCPSRALPQRPAPRQTEFAPPIPRRLR
ncbi:PREDICTED: phosphoinositide 3-kinase adapter protein 1 isoform X1 [Cyprinodon variegatus]|uniref:Phosphoinositide-3-kinase adaptor protein 1 n=1 Tax=Cyprinodon variegatus TaxID=28743 RepID=A0A3Q2DUC7_CYPVA|nr:PREDICTED: phosphoinositide 3-kinase adapter protein 1 isoform X1 [Cyprinodon variegatus]